MIGKIACYFTTLLLVCYLTTTVLGLVTLPSPDEPIQDPYFYHHLSNISIIGVFDSVSSSLYKQSTLERHISPDGCIGNHNHLLRSWDGARCQPIWACS
jgi:hypothetical protein